MGDVMPILFIDPLDLWLMMLGATLLVAAYGVYINVVRLRSVSEISRSLGGGGQEVSEALKHALPMDVVLINKGIGLYFAFVGVYALASGLVGTFLWPLPGSYNIILINPWALFGIALLIIGIALWSGINPKYIAIPLAPLGIPVIVYSFVIWSMRLTRTPELSGLMYFLIGLSALLSPLVLRESSYRRAMGWLAIVFLVVAAAIAIFIGANASFGHVAGWGKWTPWYGAVNVTG